MGYLMFRGVNKATIVGLLSKDPEIRQLKNTKVATLSLVTNEVWVDSTGNKSTKASWHRVIVYGKMAEVAEKYLKKGAEVYVEGAINYREWKTDAGETKNTTEIVVNQSGVMQMLGGKREPDMTGQKTQKPVKNESSRPPVEAYQNEIENQDPDLWSNDIPF